MEELIKLCEGYRQKKITSSLFREQIIHIFSVQQLWPKRGWILPDEELMKFAMKIVKK